MNIVLNVKGMSCPRCSSRLKGVLEEMNGVTCAVVDHAAGTAAVDYDETAVTVADLKGAVEDAGFDCE